MDLKDSLLEFVRNVYYNELQKVAKEGKQSLEIDFSDLDRFDSILAEQLLEDPENVLNVFQEVVENIDKPGDQKINVRFKNLPESRNIRVRNLRSKHLGRMWAVDVIIKSASEVKPQIYEVIFKCPGCDNLISVPQTGKTVKRPVRCENCKRMGDFQLHDKKMYDVRWISGFEPFEKTTGEQPGEINIFLKEDLTSPKMQKRTDPGNGLRIVGILKELPVKIRGKLSTKMDIYLEANNIETVEMQYEEIEITPEDEKRIIELSKDKDVYEKLMKSIAPAIHGFEEIKEAIVFQLFGGVPHVLPDGTRIRGNIHILLTGDPSVGKSQLLKLVSGIVPRGRYVSGKGVTGAGLTASVRKNEMLGTWVLEAGALILCNKGLISIDEFDKMNKDDQIAMHEAMSVETVSIAKASIVATLPAQTSVLAAANPKFGRFDRFKPVIDQIDIPETLLSRFDLKFALLDRPSKELDEKLTEHIIMSRTVPEVIEPIIKPNLLKKYIAYAKKIKHMELTKEASDLIKKFYVEMRNQYTGEGVTTVAITLRQYEAMLRLAEASAKIRLDTKIRKEDAERAIRLMKFSLTQLSYDFETGRYDIDKIESGITASQRSKITMILDIIEELQKEYGGHVAIEDVMAEAETRGIMNAEEIISKLRHEGLVFEPRSGYIKKA
jgi:replicative DNA helicase Mcm